MGLAVAAGELGTPVGGVDRLAVSTSSERLEAGVWLDPILPDLPPERRANVFAGVDGVQQETGTNSRWV